MPRDAESVVDILLASEAIGEFLKGVNLAAFTANREKQSAVIHQILIIGEACKRLSPGFRASHVRIPWSLIAGMRDRMVHAYDEIDLKIVWDAVTLELPPVIAYLKRLSPSNEDS